MLVIRLQRTGRSGHASFRIVVQDSRQSPTSGKFVALIGNYDPHSKVVNIEKDKATAFIKNGAKPSDRVAGLLKKEGVKLPEWVKLGTNKKRTIRNAEKLRKNRPPEAKVAEPKAEDKPAETPAENTEATETEEAPVETEATKTSEAETETVAYEAPVEEKVAEKPVKAGEPEAKEETKS